MKRVSFIIVITAILFTIRLGAQTNTFPTTGNVGVGTTTPAAQLDVNGSSIFRNNLTVDFGTINVHSRLTDNGLFFSRSSDGNFSSNIIAPDNALLYQARSAHRFYVSDFNNPVFSILDHSVGIGVTTPIAPLQIAAPSVTDRTTTGASQFAITNSGGAYKFLVAHDASATRLSLYSGASGNLSSIDATDNGLSINSVSNTPVLLNGSFVGIGTSTPPPTTDSRLKLAVNGEYAQTDPNFTGVFSIRYTGNGQVSFLGPIGDFLVVGPSNIVDFSAQQLNVLQRGAVFSASLAPYAVQTLAGNNAFNSVSGFTLIGTTTNPAPTDANLKLGVKGNIYAQKLKVTQTGWADYVFDKSYKLKNLQEIETYINQYKHLPEVPSAAEVEKNGIDVGDNQALLLKKIEELTLYVIDLNKKIEEQDKKIKELSAQQQKN